MDRIYYDLIKNQFIFKNTKFKYNNTVIKNDLEFLRLVSRLALKFDDDMFKSFKKDYLNYVITYKPKITLEEAEAITRNNIEYWARKFMPANLGVIVTTFMRN